MERYGSELVIVHGDATVVDECFGRVAKGHGLTVELHPARWDDLGKRAGPVRNQEMIDAGAQLCIAVHRFLMNSKGTKDCCPGDRGGDTDVPDRQ